MNNVGVRGPVSALMEKTLQRLGSIPPRQHPINAGRLPASHRAGSN